MIKNKEETCLQRETFWLSIFLDMKSNVQSHKRRQSPKWKCKTLTKTDEFSTEMSQSSTEAAECTSASSFTHTSDINLMFWPPHSEVLITWQLWVRTPWTLWFMQEEPSEPCYSLPFTCYHNSHYFFFQKINPHSVDKPRQKYSTKHTFS